MLKERQMERMILQNKCEQNPS